jgi:hypothetical protein
VNYRIYLIAVFLFPLLACSSRAMEIAAGGKASVILVSGSNPSIPEQTAIRELQAYLNKVTGGKFILQDEKNHVSSSPAIYVGNTAYAKTKGIDIGSLDSEEWVIKTVNKDLILTGGRPRGTLYAVYRFLEEVVGVHWWNPTEEFVPQKKDLDISNMDLRGKPAFGYRDIYRDFVATDDDGGWFAARNRLNRDGDHAMSAEVGGSEGYGPPEHCHTFNLYIPTSEYFKSHPEYFSLIDGKRVEGNQLCLTNEALRHLMVEKLKDNIRKSNEAAKKDGFLPPMVFDISINDCRGPCQCEKCQAIVKKEGSESGPLIDFLNFIADAIKPEYPAISISTLAYYHTQEPPKYLRPRDNIIIRLCDTKSNLASDIYSSDNASFRKALLTWSKVSKNLRLWNYGVVYHSPVLPYENMQTYAENLPFYLKHHVTGIFTELEFPERGDMHDYKVWVLAKLLEEPNRNVEELAQTFTDGYYGSAGRFVREYRQILRKSQEKNGTFVEWYSAPCLLGHLNLQTIYQSQKLFDEAENGVKDNPVLLKRLRLARLPLDRATYIFYRKLTREWVDQGHELKVFPVDRKTVMARARSTWREAIKSGLSERRRADQLKAMDEELAEFAGLPLTVTCPERFKNVARKDLFDIFMPELARNVGDVKIVKDPQAPAGYTARIEFASTADVGKYQLPLEWGVYDRVAEVSSGFGRIAAADVPGPGYHWYKLGSYTPGKSWFVYFFWSWHIQYDIGSVLTPKDSGRTFDIWANIKFEGPAFPYGGKEEKNAISIERIVLIKKV